MTTLTRMYVLRPLRPVWRQRLALIALLLAIPYTAWADNAVTRWAEQAMQTMRAPTSRRRMPAGCMPW
jgi:hypothetical protein